MMESEGPQMTSQYGAYSLRAGLARLYARRSMHTPTRMGTHMHEFMHLIFNIYCFSMAAMIDKRASMIQCMHIAPYPAYVCLYNDFLLSFVLLVVDIVWMCVKRCFIFLPARYLVGVYSEMRRKYTTASSSKANPLGRFAFTSLFNKTIFMLENSISIFD
jgi:hypothetical protein